MIRTAIFTCCLTLVSIASHAQIGAIAAGTSVGAVVDSLEQSVANTINHLDDAISNNSFKTRQHLEILMSQLNALADNQRDKTRLNKPHSSISKPASTN
jgi:hypothetical protein